jgi:hypothetical protein
MRWFTRWYGANPLHLLTLIGSFALAGYAAERLLPHNGIAILEWFVGAVIGHDLILMPLYTVADRSVMAVFRHRPPTQPTVPWINYLRVPVVLSGMLLLIWFPLIFRLATRFTLLTSLPLDPYLWHWLAVTGALFLLSAIAFAVRLGTGRGRRQAPRHGGGAADFPPRVAAGYPEGPYLEGPRYPGGPRYPQGPYPEQPYYPERPRSPQRARYPEGQPYPEQPYPGRPRYPGQPDLRRPRYLERAYPEQQGYPEGPRYPEQPRYPERPRQARDEANSAPSYWDPDWDHGA